LIFIAGPTATHAIAHAAMLRGLKPILKSDRSEESSS
jgi:multisubunit Na+/H+ antiporter MnhG subunit